MQVLRNFSEIPLRDVFLTNKSYCFTAKPMIWKPPPLKNKVKYHYELPIRFIDRT